ncbi:MAG: hypothetical protein ACM3U2_07915, partial [Deltaproteobacteria bacterium]
MYDSNLSGGPAADSNRAVSRPHRGPFLSKEFPMRNVMAANRVAWLACGLVAGLAIAYFWPHEPAYATTADRDTQFSMVTCQVGVNAAGIQDAMDAVFILDFLTGQLKGAAINRQVGKFASFYFRDLAKDFDVD